MKPIRRSYLIEINFGANAPGDGDQINFQDYPLLRDIYCTGILAADATTCTISPMGADVVGGLTGLTLTMLDINQQEILKQYPLVDLNPQRVSGFYRDIMPFPVQLTKCNINVLDGTGYAANESVLFNIFYITAAEFNKMNGINPVVNRSNTPVRNANTPQRLYPRTR